MYNAERFGGSSMGGTIGGSGVSQVPRGIESFHAQQRSIWAERAEAMHPQDFHSSAQEVLAGLEAQGHQLPEVPDEYVCSITEQIMQDPVCSKNSPQHCFERSALTSWVSAHGTHPMTREHMTLQDIQPVPDLPRQIAEWLDKLIETLPNDSQMRP